MKPDGLCMGCMDAKGEELICPQCGYREEEEPASPFYLSPGTILEGKYLLGRVLGQGGFGITYIAWDTNLKIKLAIKEYFPQELASRSIGENHISAYIGNKSDQYQYGLGKFLQEAQTLAQFDSHPNIVSVRDYFQANGTAYLVMSYVDGITLKDYLAQSGGRLPVKQATGIIMPVLDALKEVHSVNIMHRDISPDNIYINRRGQVILLDFGAARQAISEHGRSLSIILKPGYAPEEQYRTRGEQGPWTDIYATAATYYHLVTGVQPPEALERLVEDELKTPSALKADLSPEEEQALLKALAVRAGDRFQNVAEFQEALVGLSLSAYTIPVKAPASVAGAGTTAPLEPKSPTATAGQSPQASAAATQKAGSRKSKGLFIGLAIGVVAIIAVVGFIGSQQFLTVSKIVLNHQTLEMLAGKDSVTLEATIKPANASNSELIWSSSDTRVATVNNQGLVTARDEGSVLIRVEAKEGGAKAECKINVIYQTVSNYAVDGGTYSGTLKYAWTDSEWIDRPHGQGTLVYATGDEYVGEFKDGRRHGQGTDTYANGDKYVGEWKDDMFNGQGTYTWIDGDVYVGEWKDEMFNGQGTYTSADGAKYVGEWKDDLFNGQGTLTYADGAKYVGEWKDDMFNGQGTYTFGLNTEWAGDKYVGELKDGKRHGQGTYTYADGKVRSGRWENGNYLGP